MAVMRIVLGSDLLLLVGEVLAASEAPLKLELFVMESVEGKEVARDGLMRLSEQPYWLWLLEIASISCRNSSWQLS